LAKSVSHKLATLNNAHNGFRLSAASYNGHSKRDGKQSRTLLRVAPEKQLICGRFFASADINKTCMSCSVPDWIIINWYP